MEMELSLPQSIFRTYLDTDIRGFRPYHYVEAPLKTFTPPEDWNMSMDTFRSMTTLDNNRYYDTELAARPRSYVLVPSEMETDNPQLLGLGMFEYATDVLYDCHPARSTIPTQIRAVMNRDADICTILMPSPSCSPKIPLTTLFHEVQVELRYQTHIEDQDHRLTTSWFDSLPRPVQLYLAPI